MNRFHDGMSFLSCCREDVRGNYKYNVVKEVGKEDLPINFLLLFQESKNPFFLRARFLFLGCNGDVGSMRGNSGITLYFHLICNKWEMGIAFLGNTGLLVILRGLFRYGRTGGS